MKETKVADGSGRIAEYIKVLGDWDLNNLMMLLDLITTQLASGGTVTAVTNCCANCVEISRSHQWVLDLPLFVHAGHGGPQDGWRCYS